MVDRVVDRVVDVVEVEEGVKVNTAEVMTMMTRRNMAAAEAVMEIRSTESMTTE